MTIATDEITPTPAATTGALLRRTLRRVGRWFGLTAAPAAAEGLDVAEVEAVLAELHEAHQMAAPLNRKVKAAKARLLEMAAQAGLEEVPEGLYGVMLLSRGKPSERLDQPAARALLEQRGLPVPMARVRGAVKTDRVG